MLRTQEKVGTVNAIERLMAIEDIKQLKARYCRAIDRRLDDVAPYR